MKRTYFAPQTEVIETRMCQPLLAGSYIVESNVEIDGGTGGGEPAQMPGMVSIEELLGIPSGPGF